MNRSQWPTSEPLSDRDFVHRLIEKRAAELPDRLAILSWVGSLTYDQLIRASSRLAARLKGCGVGPETITPVCIEKSLWTIVSIVAILKCGGSFIHPT